MSLLVWIPMVHGDCKDQGLLGVETSVVNTVTYVDGKLGKAVQIGNGNQVTNGISINTNLVEELGTQYSCSVWVKPLGNHVHYEGAIISSGDWNKKCWAFGVNQDNSKVDIFCGGYNRNVTCSVPINQWTHLVSVNNGTYVNLYKNGELVSTTSASSWPLDSDATNTTIGRETYAGGYFSFNGCIQDLRIYDHALSPLEVKHLAQGLVLHYPLSDAYIESAINLSGGDIDNTCFNGATSKYGYGTSTDIYKESGIFQGRECTKVHMGTSGQVCFPYVHFNNLTAAIGSVRTLSFDYYPTKLDKITFYTHNTAGTTVWHNGQTKGTSNGTAIIPVIINHWNHICISVTNTGNATNGWGYMTIGNANHSSTTTDYWLFDNVMIVDGNVEKPFTLGTRSVGVITYDCSGFCNNGNNEGTITISDDTPRYKYSTVFNGSQSIDIAFNPNSNPTFTVAGWFYHTGGTTYYAAKNSYYTYVCLEGGRYFIYNNNGSAYVGNWTSTANIWQHIVLIHDSETKKLKLYVNGSFVSQIDTNGTVYGSDVLKLGGRSLAEYSGKISDFRIYATALSADDVMALYKNAGYVDSDGNVYAYEMTE